MWLVASVTIAAMPTRAAAQDDLLRGADAPAGSDEEEYRRVLQISGRAKWYPWSIRAFSPREIDRMLCPDTSSAVVACRSRPGALRTASLRAAMVLNSNFPYGANDGPVWAGRGLTGSATPAMTFQLGALSARIAPTVFWTTNGKFPLLANDEPGSMAFNDGQFPLTVDRPQRFGNGAYGRIDPGNSFVRLDTRFVTVGLSTANMIWGPAVEQAFVLGNNAPGFPHAFLGTGEPVNIFLGRLHTRFVWGLLSQSNYSPVTGSSRWISASEPGRDRLMAGMIAVFAPRGMSGLEVGISRFTHLAFPAGGVPRGFWRAPFGRLFFTDYDMEAPASNEQASIFARWAHVRSGFEVYGEYGREDHASGFRELVQDPEHQRSYMLGFQKTLGGTASAINVLRGEVFSFLLPPNARDRVEGPIYTHTQLRQGHTHHGQLLGGSAGVGNAAAATLAWDRYSRRTKTTVRWRRVVRAQRGDYFLTGVEDPRSSDVLNSAGVRYSRSHGPLISSFAAEYAYNLNRNFEGDAGNLNLRYDVRWLIR
ncbi:hypothetical protein BH23GEM2_BH23GEM2_23470 [soil metagenome]